MGYDLNRFAISVDPVFCCNLCRGVLNDPVLFDCPSRNKVSIVEPSYNQTHIFCRNCILEKVSSNESIQCPVDGRSIKKSARNKNLIQSPPSWIVSELSKLRVGCDFGCKTFLAFNELDLHRKMCEYNPHRTATPSLHMLDASNHLSNLNNLNNLNNYSPYHPHRPSPISTPAPSIMNQMQAVSGQTTACSLPGSLPGSLQSSSATSLHSTQPTSTWYNDFDSWPMYDHHSMVNQMNAANQTASTLNNSLNNSLNQASSQIHHSLSIPQQHHLSPSSNASSMFSPTQSSLSSSLPKQSQFSNSSSNQTNGNLSSSHQPIAPIPQHHTNSTAIQQSAHPLALNQHSQYNSNQLNQFATQQSSFFSPQKSNNSTQSNNLQVISPQRTASKHPMPPPSPGPFNHSLAMNQSLLKSDLEKVVETRIQQLDDRFKQNLEEIRNFLKQKQDIETNNFETEKFKSSLADFRQQLDSLKKTNELVEMKFDEKLNEKEVSLRKLLDGFTCKNGNNQTPVCTSSSKPLKKQKLRHFDSDQNEDDRSPEEQNELSSTVDTPTEQSTDLELISQKVQLECEKYMQTNLLNQLEKSSYLEVVNSHLDGELKVFRVEFEQQLQQQFERQIEQQLKVEFSDKLSKQEENLTNALTNKFNQKLNTNEKKMLKEIEDQINKLKKQFDEQVKQNQKELNKLKQESSKQRTEIDQLRKLLTKYEKLYCDEQLEDEDASSPDADKYEIVEDDNQQTIHKVDGKVRESNRMRDNLRNQSKDQSITIMQRNKRQRKSAKIASLNMNLRKTISSLKSRREAELSPIKARLRRPKEKRSDSFESLDSLLIQENDQPEVKEMNKEDSIDAGKVNKNESVKKGPKKDIKNGKKESTGEVNDESLEREEIAVENESEVLLKKKINKEIKSPKQVESKKSVKDTKISSKDAKHDESNESDENHQNDKESSIIVEETKKDENPLSSKEESPDLLAKIVNEVLFTETDQSSSHTYNNNPQFTFASHQTSNSTTILRPFFDTYGMGLNNNKFLVSLTRTINQPSQQMLLVNSSSTSSVKQQPISLSTNSLVTTTSQSIVDEGECSGVDNSKLSPLKMNTSTITSTTTCSATTSTATNSTNTTTNASKLTSKPKQATPGRPPNKRPEEESDKASSKKRSSSRLSIKKNDSDLNYSTNNSSNEMSVDQNSNNPADSKGNTKKRFVEIEKVAIQQPPTLSEGKRKRRKIHETIKLDHPKLINIKLTTQSKKKCKPVGESILMDVPTSSSSSTSSYVMRKQGRKRKASTSKYHRDELDSATDCEGEDFESSSSSRRTIENKKVKLIPKKSITNEKKRDKKSLNRVSSTTMANEKQMEVDNEKDEISSTTDHVSKDSEPKKKRKKTNDYVKRRRSKSLLFGKASSIASTSSSDKQESKKVDLLDDILSTIDNVVSKGVEDNDKAHKSNDDQVDTTAKKGNKSNKNTGIKSKEKSSKIDTKEPKNSTRGSLKEIRESKQTKESKKEKKEIKEIKLKERNCKKKLAESKQNTAESLSSKNVSKVNKDNEDTKITQSTSFAKDETDELYFEMLNGCNSTTTSLHTIEQNPTSSNAEISSNIDTNSINDSINDVINHSNESAIQINSIDRPVDQANDDNEVSEQNAIENDVERKESSNSRSNEVEIDNDEKAEIVDGVIATDDLKNGECKTNELKKDDHKNGSLVRETINDIISIIEHSSTNHEQVNKSCKMLPNENCTTNHSTNGSNETNNIEN